MHVTVSVSTGKRKIIHLSSLDTPGWTRSSFNSSSPDRLWRETRKENGGWRAMAGSAGDAAFLASGHVHDDCRAVCLSRGPLAILVCIERICEDRMQGRMQFDVVTC